MAPLNKIPDVRNIKEMNNTIFNIKNLKCGYKKIQSKRPVLEIDELEIEKGKITFFIGSSGVGKSTILESLGLMNKTIQQNENYFRVLF